MGSRSARIKTVPQCHFIRNKPACTGLESNSDLALNRSLTSHVSHCTAGALNTEVQQELGIEFSTELRAR